MNNEKPRVTIGMPVFNGENYLAEALDCLLAQTYTEFELIISDNASTDRTFEICQTYAAKDSRIRYYRNEQNLGAARNHNIVFNRSNSEYFKWSAHDDLCAPEFLQRCVTVLDQDASVVLCYSRTKSVDENGKVVRDYAAKPKLSSHLAHQRFFECVCVPHPQVAIFGLFRKSALEKTRLIGNFSASDRILLGEMALMGRFHEIDDCLFFYRNHSLQSWQLNPTPYSRQAWFDPARGRKITFPHWRLFVEHFISIRRASLGRYERLCCYAYLGWWIRLHWYFLLKNMILRDR